jgi:hypothetical protein
VKVGEGEKARQTVEEGLNQFPQNEKLSKCLKQIDRQLEEK